MSPAGALDPKNSVALRPPTFGNAIDPFVGIAAVVVPGAGEGVGVAVGAGVAVGMNRTGGELLPPPPHPATAQAANATTWSGRGRPNRMGEPPGTR
ncbi:MAG TPA: hypothetical protein VFB22_05315 [Candidatus Baltobacteraceae bacterium]|nr:hypothetical protein [Candidatus Baltobacteraceae bacterium]